MVDRRRAARWLVYLSGLGIAGTLPNGGLTPVTTGFFAALWIPYVAFVVSDWRGMEEADAEPA